VRYVLSLTLWHAFGPQGFMQTGGTSINVIMNGLEGVYQWSYYTFLLTLILAFILPQWEGKLKRKSPRIESPFTRSKPFLVPVILCTGPLETETLAGAPSRCGETCTTSDQGFGDSLPWLRR
jgi:hypothetical protein